MVSGHPLSAGVLHVRLTSQLIVLVFSFCIVGGNGTPVIGQVKRELISGSAKRNETRPEKEGTDLGNFSIPLDKLLNPIK